MSGISTAPLKLQVFTTTEGIHKNIRQYVRLGQVK